MAQLQTPSTVHAEFDHMCELVEEFEHLPSQPEPPMSEADRGEDREQSSLNGQILAGLVSPL